MRHRANAKGAPDHFVNLIAETMIGSSSAADHPPKFARKIYSDQARVGWRNFLRGRLIKKWSLVKTTEQNGRTLPDTKWRTTMMKIILQWTLQKWELRCRLCAKPDADIEQKQLFTQCQKWWESREKVNLLKTDSHLRRERWKPRPSDSTDYMRVWLQTRTIAERAFKRYRPMENQPTLHRWLVRKEG